MKIFAVISFALFGFAVGPCGALPVSSQCPGAALATVEQQSFAADLNNFAVEMYKLSSSLQKNDRSDTVFSPASIAIALGIVLQGANGTTRAEIKAALSPNTNDMTLPSAFDQLLSALNSATNQYQLSTANKLYIKQGFTLRPTFEDVVVKCFHSATEAMDVTTPEETAAQVNGWIAEQTNEKIKDLISADIITPDLRMLIINAIYFKGEWSRPFTTENGARTAKNTFTGIDGQTKEIDFMSTTSTFLYAQQSSMSVLGIPYKNNELHMFLFLPTDPTGFAAVEDSLTYAQLSKLMDAAANTRVEVMIPKFTTKSEYPLKDVLQAVGMKTMFDPQLADLTGISAVSENENLYVGAAKHKAFIEVNEKGTEAAAATGFAITVMSAMIESPPTFFANRPFMFAIRHASSGTILFMGSIVDSK